MFGILATIFRIFFSKTASIRRKHFLNTFIFLKEFCAFNNPQFAGNAESSLDIGNVSVAGSKVNITAAEAVESMSKMPATGAAVEITDLKAYRWFYLEAKN